MLTEIGADVARLLESGECSHPRKVPHYDRVRRELWLGTQLIKRFRQPAPDQETILSAFQELGWPPRIDDPLPRRPGRQSQKLRLRDAIKRLNHHQHLPLIRFRGGGRGKGIFWAIRLVS
jgi:hypothetical protein